MKPEIQPGRHIALHANCYSTIPYKRASFVANVSHVPDMNFQENSSDGNRDIAEEVHCPSSKVPLIIDGA
jgi:hypothetical protein